MKKIEYLGCTKWQANWAGLDDPRGILIIGEKYDVLQEEIHTWHTKIILSKFPNLKFNSVCFKEINMKKKIESIPLNPLMIGKLVINLSPDDIVFKLLRFGVIETDDAIIKIVDRRKL